jgi:hypothetical protein
MSVKRAGRMREKITSGEGVSMDRLLETLDSIYFNMRNVKVGSLELYEKIIPDIVLKLKECGCELYAIHSYVDLGEVRLVFSCSSTCVFVEVEVEPASLDLDKIKTDYHVLGARCSEWLSLLRTSKDPKR